MPNPPRLDESAQQRQLALSEALAAVATDASVCAHLRVEYATHTLDVLFVEDGRPSTSAPGPSGPVLVSDLQASPLFEVWCSHGEGESFSVRTSDARLTGIVRLRSVVFGELARSVRDVAVGGPSARPPRALRRVARRPDAVPLEALDRVQRAAVELPAERSLLVLGEAGHGKTTVALHRLRCVRGARRAAGLRAEAVVVVPTIGLRARLERELRELGEDVPVRTFGQLARALGKRVFTDLPHRLSSASGSGDEGSVGGARLDVRRLKRDPALLAELERRAHEPPGHIDDDPDVRHRKSRALARRSDLQQVFGDRERLARVIAASQLSYSEDAIEHIASHTSVQFELRTERALRHVDRERLVAVDHRSLDEGTPDEDAASVDLEDYAVLFELDRRRAALACAAATALPHSVDVLVLDEAQELSAIELSLLRRLLAPGGVAILAGDAGQSLEPSADEYRWTETLAHVGQPDAVVVELPLSHRSSAAVVRAARHVLPRRSPAPRRQHALPVHSERTPFGLACFVASWVRSRARALGPHGSIGVIVRTERAAARLHRLLAALLGDDVRARATLDGRFGNRGVHVTAVSHVRGLELDAVIVADVDAATYPAAPLARRALYLAITRARLEVALACVGPPSPLTEAVPRQAASRATKRSASSRASTRSSSGTIKSKR